MNRPSVENAYRLNQQSPAMMGRGYIYALLDATPHLAVISECRYDNSTDALESAKVAKAANDAIEEIREACYKYAYNSTYGATMKSSEDEKAKEAFDNLVSIARSTYKSVRERATSQLAKEAGL